MRAISGFLVLHAALVITGMAALRALGLARANRRSVIVLAGPAFLTGAAVVVPLAIVLTVLGVPLTLLSAGLLCLCCLAAATSLGRAAGEDRALAIHTGRPQRLALAALAGYGAIGAVALARLPTVLDDARIWSLRALTLFYHHGLQPEIFQDPGQSGAHPVYPLLQPALEALLYHAIGRPDLRLAHAELWLLFIAVIWTAGLLIDRHCTRRAVPPVWLGALAALALTPAAIHNVYLGDADVTGSALLGIGALALALWLESGEGGLLALAAVLLSAAASTKDEDLIAAVLVLAAALAVAPARRRGSPRAISAALAYFAVVVAPWRIWVAAHHLSDAVQPPLPRSLSPLYVLMRGHQLGEALRAIATQTAHHWGGLALVFLASLTLCMLTGTARRAASFYAVSVAALVALLVWLYATTPVSLSFLIPTSMERTIDVFMAPAAIASAFLISALAGSRSRLRPDADRQ